MLENNNTNQVYFQPRFKHAQVCSSFWAEPTLLHPFDAETQVFVL